ncbi:MAG: N-formylglutamate amidohydrolase, partial [Pseudomonadota bacterium]
MSGVFEFHQGASPLIVSIPHDGWQIPNDILQDMTGVGRGIPDTDWHVKELYDFVRDMGATLIAANYSRYVVDLNRAPDDAALYEGQLSTGLCPKQTFAGDDIYFDDI